MSNRSRAILAGAMTALVAAGCTPRAEAPSEPSPAARSAAETLARLLNSDNGLMVRSCSITGDAEQVDAALRARQRGLALPARQAEALRGGGSAGGGDEVELLLDEPAPRRLTWLPGTQAEHARLPQVDGTTSCDH
jgi:hypothetical protein